MHESYLILDCYETGKRKKKTNKQLDLDLKENAVHSFSVLNTMLIQV